MQRLWFFLLKLSFVFVLCVQNAALYSASLEDSSSKNSKSQEGDTVPEGDAVDEILYQFKKHLHSKTSSNNKVISFHNTILTLIEAIEKDDSKKMFHIISKSLLDDESESDASKSTMGNIINTIIVPARAALAAKITTRPNLIEIGIIAVTKSSIKDKRELLNKLFAFHEQLKNNNTLAPEDEKKTTLSTQASTDH